MKATELGYPISQKMKMKIENITRVIRRTNKSHWIEYRSSRMLAHVNQHELKKGFE